ncbi:hypothetical protein [Coleofasciculus sp.]|uniref:hypothetical protein n=1 Tax=Coleofasciculus sp. TaxID=3100458 RepID=UPI0039F88FA3
MTTQNFNSQCPILILKREKLGKTSLSSLREQAKKLGIIRYYSLKKATLKELVEKRLLGQDIPLHHLKPELILKSLTQKSAWQWEAEELEALNGKCLEALSCLMGIPKSGKKSVKIQRLLDMAQVREALYSFKLPDTRDHDAVTEVCKSLAARFLSRELKALCRRVKIYCPSTKYGMASALLNWLKSTTEKGMRFLSEMRQQLQRQKQFQPMNKPVAKAA